mmetsp:Transcript_744/g.2064  ORF Transcript_744/g.2064 Transcript_744/m.2064 type:complete len:249 (-) Transcript_744:406-1152(-)
MHCAARPFAKAPTKSEPKPSANERHFSDVDDRATPKPPQPPPLHENIIVNSSPSPATKNAIVPAPWRYHVVGNLARHERIGNTARTQRPSTKITPKKSDTGPASRAHGKKQQHVRPNVFVVASASARARRPHMAASAQSAQSVKPTAATAYGHGQHLRRAASSRRLRASAPHVLGFARPRLSARRRLRASSALRVLGSARRRLSVSSSPRVRLTRRRTNPAPPRIRRRVGAASASEAVGVGIRRRRRD